MQRNTSTDIFHNPAALSFYHIIAVIFAFNQHGSQFNVTIRFIAGIFNCIKHRLQSCQTVFAVKFVAETFQVNISRIHILKKFPCRFIVYKTRGHRNSFYPSPAAKFCSIYSILKKYNRIIISKSNTFTVIFFCYLHDFLRRSSVQKSSINFSFCSFPVLTEPAAHIASCCSK